MTFTYDAANQQIGFQSASPFGGGITSIATQTYDANGNLTGQALSGASLTPAYQQTTYTWDFENRLTGIQYPTGVPLTNIWSADGLRQAYIDVNGVTTLTYDMQNLYEQGSAAGVTTRYTNNPGTWGGLISSNQSTGAAEQFYTSDMAGNVRHVNSSSSAAALATYSYTAFGIPQGPGGSIANPFQFGGQVGYQQMTALTSVPSAPNLAANQVLAGVRAIDSFLARFMSMDPSGWASGDLNPYRYVGNMPTRYTDPSGLGPCLRCGPGSVPAPDWNPVHFIYGICADCCQNRITLKCYGNGSGCTKVPSCPQYVPPPSAPSPPCLGHAGWDCALPNAIKGCQCCTHRNAKGGLDCQGKYCSWVPGCPGTPPQPGKLPCLPDPPGDAGCLGYCRGFLEGYGECVDLCTAYQTVCEAQHRMPPMLPYCPCTPHCIQVGNNTQGGDTASTNACTDCCKNTCPGGETGNDNHLCSNQCERTFMG
jgi:RHS repeat-associated protein